MHDTDAIARARTDAKLTPEQDAITNAVRQAVELGARVGPECLALKSRLLRADLAWRLGGVGGLAGAPLRPLG